MSDVKKLTWNSGTIKYVESQINPAFNLLKNTDPVSLTIETHGSAQDQKQEEIRCQNGSSEGKANTFMKCSISAYPEPKDYLQIIGCSFQNLLAGGKPVEQAEKAFSTCALKMALISVRSMNVITGRKKARNDD